MTEKILFQSDGGPVTQKTIFAALRNAGISKGDIVMVHSRLFSLGKLADVKNKDELLNIFIDALLEAAGATGSLVFPTFTLSFCKTGIFDLENSKSEMGVLSEGARNKEGAVRTKHPIYSVAIIGPSSKPLLNSDNSTCFGKNSIFDKLHVINKDSKTNDKVKFLTIGVPIPPRAITYLHSLEEKIGVPYRYFKEFEGIIIANNQELPAKTEFFVRNKEKNVVFNGDACWKLWQESQIAKTEPLGDSFICVIKERSLYDVTISAIQKNNHFLYIAK